MKSKSSQQKGFLKIITIPIRALTKARDLYVKSVTDYADRMNYGNVMPVHQVSGLPKSFSVGSAAARSNYDNDDFRELVRVTSARKSSVTVLGDYVDSGMKDQQMRMKTRSSSVAMRRIDEDSPCCYFDDDNIGGYYNSISAKNGVKYPRSRSHAVTARRLPAF